MAKINQRTQHILESMIVNKFSEKRNALAKELDAIKERDCEIANENMDKCKDFICRYMEHADELIHKALKTAGLEIGSRYYYGGHAICLFDSDCKLKSNWKEYVRPIAKKDAKRKEVEQKLDELTTKCRKAMDELILRASLGCKYDDVMKFINNLEV